MNGNTKAANVINTLAVIKETFGEGPVASLIAVMPPATRAICQRRLLAVEWVSYGDWFRFLDAVCDELLGGDEEKLFALGCKFCERDFGGVYKVFLRFGSPAFILDRTAKVWSTYYDFAKLEATKRVQDGAKSLVRVELSGFLPLRRYPILLHAFVHQTLTMSGAKGLAVTRHRQRIEDGRLSCGFEVRYD
jgi:hypothetical protein